MNLNTAWFVMLAFTLAVYAVLMGSGPGQDPGPLRAQYLALDDAKGIAEIDHERVHDTAAVMLDGPEDNLAGLIVAWYAAHLRGGGDPDPIAEQLGAEIRAEDGYDGLE